MLESAIITSLKILFIYAAMRQGMILFPVRRLIDRIISYLPAKLYLWIRKPLYDCYFCMASVWGVVLALLDSPDIQIDAFGTYQRTADWLLSWRLYSFLLLVAGCNYIIQSLLKLGEWE